MDINTIEYKNQISLDKIEKIIDLSKFSIDYMFKYICKHSQN